MSRGLSWRQRTMLKDIAHHAERSEVVAWRDIDNGPGGEDDDYFSPRASWNREQTIRRSLRSLERRGLVTLGRYCFAPDEVINGLGFTSLFWTCIDPEDHVPGEGRIMTGVELTDAGRAVIAATSRSRPPAAAKGACGS